MAKNRLHPSGATRSLRRRHLATAGWRLLLLAGLLLVFMQQWPEDSLAQSVTGTPTSTATHTLTVTPSMSLTASATLTATLTLSPSPTQSPTHTHTVQATGTASVTPFPSATFASPSPTMETTPLETSILPETAGPPAVITATATLAPLPVVTYQASQITPSPALSFLAHQPGSPDLPKETPAVFWKRLARWWPVPALLAAWLLLALWFILAQRYS